MFQKTQILPLAELIKRLQRHGLTLALMLLCLVITSFSFAGVEPDISDEGKDSIFVKVGQIDVADYTMSIISQCKTARPGRSDRVLRYM